MPVDPSYLEQVAALDFKGVEWTREKILEVRDLLSPWNHNIALPQGVYTAACEDYYPAHREIMRIVRERLGPDFSGRRIADIGCLEGYFSIECALQGAEVLGIDGKLLNVRKCEFVRSVLAVERATYIHMSFIGACLEFCRSQALLLETAQMITPTTRRTRMTPVQTPALKISAITSQPARVAPERSRSA